MKAIKTNAMRAALLLICSLLLPHQIFSQEDWFATGLRLTRARQYDKAIEAFTAAIELIPGDVEAYNHPG